MDLTQKYCPISLKESVISASIPPNIQTSVTAFANTQVLRILSVCPISTVNYAISA